MLIELQARNPAANCLRQWRIELERDLFGNWVADIRFGRIGLPGRALHRIFPSQAEALAFLRQRLRRRATAPIRIGVAYRYVRASHEALALLADCNISSAD